MDFSVIHDNLGYLLDHLSAEDLTRLLEAIRILEEILGAKATLRFEPRQPGDPLRTSADCSRIRDGLGFAPATDIRQGLAAEAGWALGLYAGKG